jgi:hypothetical protein
LTSSGRSGIWHKKSITQRELMELFMAAKMEIVTSVPLYMK